MIVRLYSDLHMDFAKYKITELPNDAESVLVLAGDLGEGGKPREFIERHCKRFKFVLYVLGNHEFYRGEYHEVIQYWKDREAEIDNLFVLHNEVFEHEGVRFLGTTLWTDYNNGDWHEMENAKRIMNDFHIVRIIDDTCTAKHKYKPRLLGRALTPQDTYEFHREAVAFLEEELSKEYDGITNVITHHSPSHCLVEDVFRDSTLNSAFHANCDNLLMKYKIDNWFYGHTHFATQRKLGDTYVYSNPRGYVGYENQNEIGFDNEFWLDMDDKGMNVSS